MRHDVGRRQNELFVSDHHPCGVDAVLADSPRLKPDKQPKPITASITSSFRQDAC